MVTPFSFWTDQLVREQWDSKLNCSCKYIFFFSVCINKQKKMEVQVSPYDRWFTYGWASFLAHAITGMAALMNKSHSKFHHFTIYQGSLPMYCTLIQKPKSVHATLGFKMPCMVCSTRLIAYIVLWCLLMVRILTVVNISHRKQKQRDICGLNLLRE